MSLRNTTHLMSSMVNRASGITFDPVIPIGRPQFNPVTGSWVFGLAAFAAGVAINKMINPEASVEEKGSNTPAPSGDSQRGHGHMHSLLRDTMAEEARSGDHIDSISSEVARLRDEIASLSAQKEQVREHGFAADAPDSQVLEQEFEKVRATLHQLKIEKDELSRTEQELLSVLRSQSSSSPYAEVAQRQLTSVQSELSRLKNEQVRIESEYDSNKSSNDQALAAVNSLEIQLEEKVVKLQEAELREQALRNDHRVLMETVESLKTQLEFFRSKATQDQSGVTSLKILEESNNKLNEQVSSSLYQAEQQQAALHRLAAEKSQLAQELEQYKAQVQSSERRMTQLEAALNEAKKAENVLLQKVEELSELNRSNSFDASEQLRLESELESARLSIQALESKEKELQSKLDEAENSILQGDSRLFINQLTAERDALQKALDSSDQNFRDLEANYNEQIVSAQQVNGSAKTDLVIAAEKEEELNHQISGLLLKVKALENERDLFRSRAEVVNLHATDAGNEFMALKQTILTLESEKKSLVVELGRHKSDAEAAQNKLADTEEKLQSLSKDEVQYKDEITSIQASISGHQKLKDDFLKQKEELNKARHDIKSLIEKNQQKDQELVVAQRELAQVQFQLNQLSQRSAHLESEGQSTTSRVSLIQDELSQKDQVIANSRVQEEALRREVDTLRQTAANMESEIKRLKSLQTDLGASSSSLQLLQQTEKQLRDQIGQANSEIARQHKRLLDAENSRVQLEVQQRDESLKLAAIQSENSALKDQLKKLQLQERDQQNIVSQSNREREYLQNLSQEAKMLEQRKAEIEQRLLHSQAQEKELQSRLGVAEQKLQELSYERDSLQRELVSVKKELAQVVTERDDLQATCRHLETSLKDLEHKKSKGSARIVESNQVIPLTAKDVVSSPDEPEYEELDTSVFDEASMEAAEFDSLSSNKLFQSTKPSARLRKFKGHRKIEDIEAKEQELDSRIKENLEHAEEIDLDNEDENDEDDVKRKAYSPNRSFSDLLEDSERRKSESKPVDLEKGWNELDADEFDEEIIDEEKSSIKPLLYGGAAAGILIGSSLSFLYLNGRDANTTTTKPDTAASGQSGASDAVNTIPDSSKNPVIDQKVNESSVDKQALELLSKFHDAKDFGVKSKLCRVPNRTLKDMKIYAATNAQDFTIDKVEVREKPLVQSGLTLLVADVQGELDGQPINKVVYFEKNSQGDLLLDWYSYVNYERVRWSKYLNFDDDKSSEDWHVIIKPESNDLDDFPEDKFASFKVRSWNPDTYGSTYAYLSKKDPMYEQLMEALKKNQTRFILRLRHKGDGSLALIVDEVVSLSQFYLTDIEDSVSSSFGDISFGDASY